MYFTEKKLLMIEAYLTRWPFKNQMIDYGGGMSTLNHALTRTRSLRIYPFFPHSPTALFRLAAQLPASYRLEKKTAELALY